MTKNVTYNRKVFVVSGDDKKQIAFAKLQRGETFELYEADDTLVGVYKAIGVPYLSPEEIWTIDVEPAE